MIPAIESLERRYVDYTMMADPICEEGGINIGRPVGGIGGGHLT